MTMKEYAKSRGLEVKQIAKKMGVTRQNVYKIGSDPLQPPRVGTLLKVAKAMTELGAPTTVVDLVAALYATAGAQ